jgi:hypothetical protein
MLIALSTDKICASKSILQLVSELITLGPVTLKIAGLYLYPYERKIKTKICNRRLFAVD